MRPSVFAVSMATALLMPGVAALADPPWERGHEYEAHGCKYEYKAGPHGFKEEYKCDGGSPRYAGGPPPWAPAHGWRRKHAEYHQREAGYVVPDLGIGLGRCNRDVIGAVIGGAAGGAIGSRIGKGSDRTVATIGGTIVGVLIGGAIGRSMDQADQVCLAQTLEQAPAQHAVMWSNPDSGHYRVVPLKGYEDSQGRICRDYRTTATIEGASSTSMAPPTGSRTGAGSGRAKASAHPWRGEVASRPGRCTHLPAVDLTKASERASPTLERAHEAGHALEDIARA